MIPTKCSARVAAEWGCGISGRSDGLIERCRDAYPSLSRFFVAGGYIGPKLGAAIADRCPDRTTSAPAVAVVKLPKSGNGSPVRGRMEVSMLGRWFRRKPGFAQTDAAAASFDGIKDLVFIDLPRLNAYVDQLGVVPSEIRKEIRKIGGTVTGPSAEVSIETVPGAATTVDKVRFLTKKLRERNCLFESRKAFIASGDPGLWDDRSTFILDRCRATPLLVPASALPGQLGISAIRLWLSEPDSPSADISVDNSTEFNWDERPDAPIEEDAFLFLTELIFDGGERSRMLSGHTALSALFAAMRGKDLPFDDPYGSRMPTKNPDVMLADFGAIKGEPRAIECLYRIRYMTNEQFYVRAGLIHRCFDIVGYPIYIAA